MNDNQLPLKFKPVNNCPICKGKQIKLINKTQTINPYSALKIEILSCQSCSHWFVNPMLKQHQLNILYEKGSEYVVSKGGNPRKTSFSIPEEYIIKQESKTPFNKKYLEIGVGSGLLFNHFRRIGYYCYRVDPGHWARGIPNVLKEMNHLQHEDKFDVVVLIDVVEHVEDPISLMKKVSDITNPNSTVYASFPNNQSLRAFLFKERWRMIRPFGHLHFFSKHSLTILFEFNGFKIQSLIKTDLLKFKNFLFHPYFIFWTVLSITQPFCGDQWIAHLTKHRKVDKNQTPTFSRTLNVRYDYDINFNDINSQPYNIVRLITPRSRILDIGCATGRLGKYLREHFQCYVVGIDIDPANKILSERNLDEFYIMDANNFDSLQKFLTGRNFDFIILADILEHLIDPDDFLRKLSNSVNSDVHIIVSVPNISFWEARLKLFFGSFEYTPTGIFDKSHLHFYNLHYARKTFKTFFNILGERYSSWYAPAEKLFYLRKIPLIKKLTYFTRRILTLTLPNLFASQLIFLLQSKKDR